MGEGGSCEEWSTCAVTQIINQPDIACVVESVVDIVKTARLDTSNLQTWLRVQQSC